MKTIPGAILLMSCLVCSPSVLAEHQTYLRGIVNVPGLQGALLEIGHALGKRTNTPHALIKTSRLVRAGEQLEDETIKGEHFQFEVLQVDVAGETVRTREGGEDHTYTLPVAARPATARHWLHLQKAGLKDVVDLYSRFAGRVILIHPAVDRAPVSLEAVWTNQVPDEVDVGDAFANCFEQRGAAAVVDGEHFVQVIPRTMSPTAAPRSKDLPASAAEADGALYFYENADTDILVDLYGRVSGRRRTSSAMAAGVVPYFRTFQPLSKPEVLYALETLLEWQDVQIRLNDDDTFTLVRRSPQATPLR